MDFYKVACTIIYIIDIVNLIASFIVFFTLLSLGYHDHGILITFAGITIVLAVFLLNIARFTKWSKKKVVMCWLVYNILLGILLACYGLYSMAVLVIKGAIDERNKNYFFIYMAVSICLTVVYLIKSIIIWNYYVSKLKGQTSFPIIGEQTVFSELKDMDAENTMV